MAINRFLQSSVQSGLPKFDSVWDGRSAVGSMEPISSITLSAAQSSVQFNNIPQTYSHLQIRYMARYTGSVYYDAIRIRINSDSGNNYTNHYLIGEGSTASANNDSPFSSIKYASYIAGASAIANNFSPGILDILDYANTSKNKTIKGFWGYENNNTGSSNAEKGFTGLGSGAWMNTNAITSINFDVYLTGVSFAQNSVFSLYGIK